MAAFAGQIYRIESICWGITFPTNNEYIQSISWKTTALVAAMIDECFMCENCRNGTWDDGGLCDAEMEPEKNYKKLKAEPWNNQYISDVIKQMTYGNWKVQLLNITYLTEFRKDGHPSRHREPGTPGNAPQDCSHWCLPGIPDTWNELLYAHLLSMEFRTK